MTVRIIWTGDNTVENNRFASIVNSDVSNDLQCVSSIKKKIKKKRKVAFQYRALLHWIGKNLDIGATRTASCSLNLRKRSSIREIGALSSTAKLICKRLRI